ncbi:MAG: MFS transporter [candidate division FCPU426 bacterium]
MRRPAFSRAVWSWCLYDWANSAFATTVMAGFFPVFFKQYWSAGADPVASTGRLALANSAAGLALAVLGPWLGAAADQGSARKRFLAAFALLGLAATSAFAAVPSGAWILAVGLYILASIGFSGGNIFYDALLTRVSPPEDYNAVSARGYALGYVGGGLLLALNIWMVGQPGRFGLANAADAVRASFVLVAGWWLVFSLPLWRWVPEPLEPGAERGWSLFGAGLRRLQTVWRELRTAGRPVLLFLAAYICYIAGVFTIMRMAVDYGLALGLSSRSLLLALLLTQAVGFPAALAFGMLGRRLGARPALLLAIVIYALVTLGGMNLRSAGDFFLLAAGIGLVQGGIQALSRAWYATLISRDSAAAFFGLYDLTGKLAIAAGPLLLGAAALAGRHFGLAGDQASRLSLSVVLLLFALGAAFLMINPLEPHGRRPGHH